jgi:hypothetical protein
MLQEPWTNSSLQDKIWCECSTLDQGNLAYAMQLRLQQKQPNLELNTRLKQVLGSLLSAFVSSQIKTHASHQALNKA